MFVHWKLWSNWVLILSNIILLNIAESILYIRHSVFRVSTLWLSADVPLTLSFSGQLCSPSLHNLPFIFIPTLTLLLSCRTEFSRFLALAVDKYTLCVIFAMLIMLYHVSSKMQKLVKAAREGTKDGLEKTKAAVKKGRSFIRTKSFCHGMSFDLINSNSFELYTHYPVSLLFMLHVKTFSILSKGNITYFCLFGMSACLFMYSWPFSCSLVFIVQRGRRPVLRMRSLNSSLRWTVSMLSQCCVRHRRVFHSNR